MSVLAAREETVPFVGLEPHAVSQRWDRDAGSAYAPVFIFGRPSADVSCVLLRSRGRRHLEAR